jgi:hypothetical protein
MANWVVEVLPLVRGKKQGARNAPQRLKALADELRYCLPGVSRGLFWFEPSADAIGLL